MMRCLDILNKSCNDIIDINNSKTGYLNEKSVQMKIAFDLWKTLGIELNWRIVLIMNQEINYTDIFLKDVSVKVGIEIKFKRKNRRIKLYKSRCSNKWKVKLLKRY